MQVDITAEERQALLGWKKRSDSLILIRLKAEAILYASHGVDLDLVAETVGRTVRTVKEWLSGWRATRLHPVITGHAGNENAAKLTREQEEQLKEVLSRPPSESGISADLWDVPALANVVRTTFDVEYKSDSSYRLLTRFLGTTFKLPDPFDERRDEKAVNKPMTQVRDQVEDLPAQGREVYAVDEVRVEHETETRRMWLPAGRRTKICVDRGKAAQSFFGALSLTAKKMKIYPIEGSQNAEQVIFAVNRLARETDSEKIAVVLDNAGFHHAKAVTELFKPGQQLERITPIFLPPYAPDHDPVEHVWNTARNHIANIQHGVRGVSRTRGVFLPLSR